MRSTRCGRLDRHPAHTWLGRNHDTATPSIPRHCSGELLIEGGAR